MKQIGENETQFVRPEENSNWKEALHLRFYYYLDPLQTNKLPIRSTCTTQSIVTRLLYEISAVRSFVYHPLMETQWWSVGLGERKRCEIFFKQGALPPMLENVLSRLFSRPSDYPWISKDVGRKPLIGKVIIEAATEQKMTEIYSTY